MSFSKIRKSKIKRYISFFLALNIVFEIVSPSVAFALTSGPAQEEFASFEPASTTDMVDLYTGDYNYNIPLLSVPGPNGGYPINIAYHSGIGMEQEASWVGLGWNINVGAINRQLRGLPDDFAGQKITKTQHVKSSWSVKLDIPMKKTKYTETIGIPTNSGSVSKNNWQIYYNNYRGLGMRYTFNTNPNGDNGPAGLGISVDSQNGIGLSPSFSSSSHFGKTKFGGGFDLGLNYTSRGGIESFNFSAKISKTHTKLKDSKKYKDKGGEAVKQSFSSSISFASSFSVPKTNMEMKSTTVPFTLKLGKARSLFLFQSKFPGMWSGSVYTSNVQNKGVDNVEAYGYLNTNISSQPDVMKDFNRKDISYSKKIPHLGSSSFTYDLYSQSGQGTGSMFRPHLNTFGILSDPQKISSDRVVNSGLEVGVGLGAGFKMHLGIDFELGGGQNSSGPWTQIAKNPDMGTKLRSNFKNWTSSNSNNDYENYYFKVIGEKTGEHHSEHQLNDFGGDQALRLAISKDKNDNNWLNRQFVAEDKLVHAEWQNNTPVAILNSGTNQSSSKKRIKRSTSIEPLNPQDAAQYGYSKNVKYVQGGSPVNKDFAKPSGNMSEISMVQADGMRYVYGLPAYNTKQIDNSFAILSPSSSFNTSTVPINTSGSTIGGVNVSGTNDEFVSKNEMPEYAHSWLLTSVLSTDYLDVTGDGPTEDDYGYWVKFNYKKVFSDYKWRMPYKGANYMEGQRNNPSDDKASYTFGSKEIYIIESIETKTHIAKFETSDRHDAYEAANEYVGGQGSQKMQKLDKIKLYTKRELLKGTSAVPTKVANFEYSYDLCPGVPNNDSLPNMATYMDANGVLQTNNRNIKRGKLTLNKIYFTYQNSTRGAFSPYIFSYGNLNDVKDNPRYNTRNMDRWGNFKDNTGKYPGTTNNYPYVDNPYTDQDPGFYDANGLKAGQWTLKQINLPSGGIMKMDYDFDDYAFVEDQRALRMFDIYGLGEDPPLLGGSGNAYIRDAAIRNGTTIELAPTEARVPGGGANDDNRVWFKLEAPVSSKAEFKAKYIDNLPGNYVYFSTYTELKDGIFDYVKGYAEIDVSNSDYYGYQPFNGHDYGFITLKPKPLANKNVTGVHVSPFTRAAIEHLRANRSELLNSAVPYSNNAAAQIYNIVGTIIPPSTLLQELFGMAIGFNNYAFLKNWGKTIRLNGYSTIRLCDPDYKKIGGGVRVKKITLDDNWKNDPASSTAQNSLYGQEYDYTKKTTINGVETTISSGVAYEPQVGSEESALKTPVPYSKSTLLGGNYNLFMENPIMEDYYPGAGVGYSKVTVKSIAPERAKLEDSNNDLNHSAAPIVVHEFYTQKDFPVIFDKTDMNPGQPIKQPLIIPGVFSGTRRRQTKSQGYSIVLNDMAGKQKSITTMSRVDGKIISRQEFIYNTETSYNENSINKLSSKVQTLEIDGDNNINYITSVVGQDHEMFIDMNEDDQSSRSFGINLNLDLQITPPSIIPLFFIMPLPVISSAHNNLRTVVFNKVINRTGILKKVITTTEQSTIITENLAFDIETGEALVTKVTNEFKDPIYNMSYPGHWYYPNMRGSYQNIGYTIDLPGTSSFISNTINDAIDLSGQLPVGRKVSEHFAKGDVLRINSSNNQYDGNYHVFSINDATNEIYCINSLGEYFPKNIGVESIKVIKSGFKNMLSTKVGGVTFKEMNTAHNDFIDYNSQTNSGYVPMLNAFSVDVDNKIINASAVEYSDDWQVFGGQATPSATNCVCTLSPLASDFIGMLQSLTASGNLYQKNLKIYDVSTDTYMHGFTSALLSGNSRLFSMKNTMALSPSPTKHLRYSGQVQSNGDLWMYFHSYATNYISIMEESESNYGVDAWCKIILHSNTGTYNWHDIQSFNSISAATSGTNCSVPDIFNISVSLSNSSEPENFSVLVDPNCPDDCGGDCWNFYEGCNTVISPDYACGIQVGESINPYLAGLKGMWRPKASYSYNTERTQTNNIRTDGVYTNYTPFPWHDPQNKDEKWINAATITKYSPYGFELENKNALGNYSSSVYGYKHSLVVASGSNAKYNELAFDNFEDYPLDCNENHFKFPVFASNVKYILSPTDPGFAHTGKHAMQVINGTNVSVTKPMSSSCTFSGISDAPPPPSQSYGSPAVLVNHVVAACDLLGEFNPDPSKKYVASVWVKQVSSSNTEIPGLVDFTAPKLKITISITGGSPIVYTFNAKGNVIDGWQRIFEEFDIPSDAIDITVELVNTSSTGHITYFDDIRLHPFDANMASYVYDPITLKVLAELDANNFATIYTYDDEGHLYSVKKETVEGVKTIKEGRINTKKINE